MKRLLRAHTEIIDTYRTAQSKMTARAVRLGFSIIFLLLSACGTVTPRRSTTEPASATETTTTPVKSTATSLVTQTPRVRRVWLPALFDPNANRAASRLLKARLDSFARLHADIFLDV